MPGWWEERRFGLLVRAGVSTVPAWAPIGQDAGWYRCHLGEDVDDVGVQIRPMVETLAHHRDRWGHIERYDDFAPLLHFDRFDAEAWATLARNAGAGYTVLSAKPADGWAWWDAPGARRRLTEVGPKRDVVAAYAAACERNDVVFGASYSLVDWADERYPSDRYVTEVLHPDVIDLVRRYGVRLLEGDGGWAHDAGVWRVADLLAAVREIDPDVVVDDGWRASSADLPADAPPIPTRVEGVVPDRILLRPWEFRRSVGLSDVHDVNEGAEHHLTGFEIVSLLTEVVAKGGHLLLGVGPSIDGTIPDLQAGPLADAGTWIRRHADLVATSRPWTEWGDEHVRYLSTGDRHATGDDGRAGDALFAIDVSGRGRFDALAPSAHRVTSVDVVDAPPGSHDVTWRQDDGGLHVVARPRADGFDDDRIGIAVYRVVHEPVGRPAELFEPTPPTPIELAPLLEDARPGDIVQLGDGVHVGPATVPAGVIVRGLGPSRTVIETIHDAPSIRPDAPAVRLDRNARIEHLAVRRRASSDAPVQRFPRPVVDLAGPFASVLGCRVEGVIAATADDGMVRATTLRGVVAEGVDRVHVTRCTLSGNRWDVGIGISGGADHLVDSCDLSDHLAAIRVVDAGGIDIRGNAISARWWGVHLQGCERAHVHANHVRSTMRAVDIDGGTGVLVDGNAAFDGDSGCVVQEGATACRVIGNHWERCRIGLLGWDAPDLSHHDNRCSELHDPDGALVTGP